MLSCLLLASVSLSGSAEEVRLASLARRDCRSAWAAVFCCSRAFKAFEAFYNKNDIIMIMISYIRKVDFCLGTPTEQK